MAAIRHSLKEGSPLLLCAKATLTTQVSAKERRAFFKGTVNGCQKGLLLTYCGACCAPGRAASPRGELLSTGGE